MKTTVLSAFPDDIQRTLVAQICEHRGARNVYLCPFRRFGFSGASLLQAFFSDRRSGVPYLIKIAPLQSAKEEFDAVASMRDVVIDCRLEDHKLFSCKINTAGATHARQWGALLYTNKGSGGPTGADSPLALREVFFDRKRCSTTTLKRVMEQTLRKLDNAHRSHERVSVMLRDHYRAYFRRHKSVDRITGVLGPNASQPTLNFLGAKIYNPLHFVNELPSTIEVHQGRVHGDLHPDNIIINSDGVPTLIDFAWAKEKRDLLVDFALLETSIRFMAFPVAANLDEQLRVDRALLNANGCRDVAGYSFTTTCVESAFNRMACGVGVIRRRAQDLLGAEFSMNRYLLTQFIVLYGLLKYPEYNAHICTRVLGMLARQLNQHKRP